MKYVNFALVALLVLFMTSTVLLGQQLYKTQNATALKTQELEQDLTRTEEARQTLNDLLWEQKQINKELFLLIEQQKRDYDVVTSDRERIRTISENKEADFLALIANVSILDEESFANLCQGTSENLHPLLPHDSEVSSTFVESVFLQICED